MKTICPRCQSAATVKNGSVKGAPKRQCKACGYQFTRDIPRGLPLARKMTAVLLYLHGLSMNATAKLLGVSTPAVLQWIRAFALQHRPPPEAAAEVVEVEVDELWHFLEKKLASSGFGRPTAGQPVILWLGSAGVAIRPRFGASTSGCSNKGCNATTPTAGKSTPG